MDPVAEAMNAARELLDHRQLLIIVITVPIALFVANWLIKAVLAIYQDTHPSETAKRKNDEKPKNDFAEESEGFELGDDGELPDTFEQGSMTLDDLINQYDRMED